MTGSPGPSGRLLTLLSLLQTPREWPGAELADRLRVSRRTVRNDVERLRSLGYPVEATRGPVGGYRLAAGTAMPPLLLDDDEAVAVVVALRTTTSGGAELQQTALQALTKLQQVLPNRLAHRVDALQTTTLRASRPRPGPQVDAAVLSLVAATATGREVLRFAYSAHSGEASERRVEPYRLVSLGLRWYLVAFDLDRDDWRTFRVDRVREPRSVGHRFRARELPADDVAAWVAGKTRDVQLKVLGRVEVHAPAAEVAARMAGWTVGAVEVVDDDSCRLSVGGPSVEKIALWLGFLDADFEVVDSPDLARAVRDRGERYLRAAPSSAPS